jgi:hypothetical protein
VAPIVLAAVALRVGIVENIVRLLYIHRERIRTPLGGVGWERKLGGLNYSALKVQAKRDVRRHLIREGRSLDLSICGLSQFRPRDKRGERGRTGDERRVGEVRVEKLGFGRRAVDELAISGL